MMLSGLIKKWFLGKCCDSY